MSKKLDMEKLYYFIDVHLESRKIVGWGCERRDVVEVTISNGCHRLFVSKGQYNKLTEELSKSGKN